MKMCTAGIRRKKKVGSGKAKGARQGRKVYVSEQARYVMEGSKGVYALRPGIVGRYKVRRAGIRRQV